MHIGAGNDADAGAVAGKRACARAGALVTARAAACGLGKALFRAQDFGKRR